jgi:hypothetical protein
MFEKMLDQMAEKIKNLDEASLTQLLPYYKRKMEKFEPTEEWEKAVIIFFLINAVRVKNTIFNENILKNEKKKEKGPKDPNLKLVKS